MEEKDLSIEEGLQLFADILFDKNTQQQFIMDSWMDIHGNPF